MNRPRYIFLSCAFPVLKRIDYLPFFHGALWSAMFRHAYNRFLAEGEEFQDTGISFAVTNVGVNCVESGQTIEVGVNLPTEEWERFVCVLKNLPQSAGLHGQFEPGKTLSLADTRCRVCGKSITESIPCDLGFPQITEEVPAPISSEFTLHFTSPLQLILPLEARQKKKEYCSLKYWKEDPGAGNYLLKALLDIPKDKEIDLEARITGVHGFDYTVIYGRREKKKKYLPGFWGWIRLNAKSSEIQKYYLQLKGCIGGGTKGSFGLGQFYMAGASSMLHSLSLVEPFSEKIIATDSLKRALREIRSDSIVEQGVGKEDFGLLENRGASRLQQIFRHRTHEPLPPQKISLPKNDGTFRRLWIPDTLSQLFEKSCSAILTEVLDSLFSGSSLAYRPGKSRRSAVNFYVSAFQRGCIFPLKTDICKFFDSIPFSDVIQLLECLFPSEFFMEILRDIRSKTPDFLVSGYALSPLLSNLYMHGIDLEISKYFSNYVRYGDDFLLMFGEKSEREEAKKIMEEMLDFYGFRLSEEKTLLPAPDESFTYMGYSLANGVSVQAASEELKTETDRSNWQKLLEAFRKEGKTVYVTSSCYKVNSEAGNLVFHNSANKVSVPWSEVGSIVVIGKQRLSGGVFETALQRQIPIFFQRLTGFPVGRFVPVSYSVDEKLIPIQRNRFADKDYVLSCAKELVKSAIHSKFRLMRSYKQMAEFDEKEYLRKIDAADSLEVLRGYEGNFAARYFRAYADLCLPFRFEGRSYYPPSGPVNAMLSLCYSLFYYRISAALFRHGFDIRDGFYHQKRGSHAALASDINEIFRFIGDKLVLNLIRLKMLRTEHFLDVANDGNFNRLNPDAYRIFIRRFEQTLSRSFYSKDSASKISMNGFIEQTVRKLSASLKLDIVFIPETPKL